jgi:uncharacterized protein YodC (DUF2158 family)
MTNKASKQKLHEGDVVQLKSGGPPMTICAIDGQTANCEWFKNESVVNHDFQLHSLEDANLETGDQAIARLLAEVDGKTRGIPSKPGQFKPQK